MYYVIMVENDRIYFLQKQYISLRIRCDKSPVHQSIITAIYETLPPAKAFGFT